MKNILSIFCLSLLFACTPAPEEFQLQIHTNIETTTALAIDSNEIDNLVFKEWLLEEIKKDRWPLFYFNKETQMWDIPCTKEDIFHDIYGGRKVIYDNCHSFVFEQKTKFQVSSPPEVKLKNISVFESIYDSSQLKLRKYPWFRVVF